MTEILVPLEAQLGKLVQGLREIPFYQDFSAGKVTASDLVMVYRQFYPYIAQTPDTLKMMAITTRTRYANHPEELHGNLWTHFHRHQKEESGHGVLLLEDLKALGRPASRAELVLLAWDPVQDYIDSAIEMATKYPVGNIGEAYVLEGITPQVEGNWEQVVRNSGISNIENAVSFMRAESEADTDHIDVRKTLIQDLEQSREAEIHGEYILRRARDVSGFYLTLWQKFDQKRDS